MDARRHPPGPHLVTVRSGTDVIVSDDMYLRAEVRRDGRVDLFWNNLPGAGASLARRQEILRRQREESGGRRPGGAGENA